MGHKNERLPRCHLCRAEAYHKTKGNPALVPVIKCLAPLDPVLTEAVGPRWWVQLHRHQAKQEVAA